MNVGDLSVSANIGIGCSLLVVIFALHRRASTGKWPVPMENTVYMVLCGCFALWNGANFINGVLAGERMSAAFDGISVIGFTVLGADRVRVALGKRSLFQRRSAALSK